ncbi:hypothetical protein GYH30_022445 [Glycine max]|nr:hypothetical protein GYH30_022445 [Glycine max]
MASRRGGVSLPDKPSNNSSSILVKISRSSIITHDKEAAGDAAFVAKKLLRSTGKAACIPFASLFPCYLGWDFPTI